MRNCPSALWTAVTSITDIPDGVAVSVTVSNPFNYRRLLALAELHARSREPGGAQEHSGGHGGPGDTGRCPILHNGTEVSYARIPDGIRFDVRAEAGGDVEALRSQTRSRAAAMQSSWIVN
jgi:hypothetical protein